MKTARTAATFFAPPALALQPLDRREDAPPFSLALIEPGKLGIDRTVPWSTQGGVLLALRAALDRS
jgi:hypothetical protein